MPNIPNKTETLELFLTRINPSGLLTRFEKVYQLASSKLTYDEYYEALSDYEALLSIIMLVGGTKERKPVMRGITPIKPPAKPPVRLTRKWRRKSKPGTANIIDITPPGMAG